MNYLETVLSGEEFIYSYDNKYCYLPMYSERKRLCTLNIYETSTERIPGAEEQIVPGDLVFILPYYYDGNKINLISWGKENYNIYFDSKEAGKFCFIYENGEWQGPQKWDIYQ